MQALVPTTYSDRPRTASMRGVYRHGLPTIYQADDLCMRFVAALEEVLDPLVAVVDGLASYLDPDIAPPDVLQLMAGWLGLAIDETWPVERARELVRRAGQLLRLKGTRAGLELALEVAFPDLPLRVVETGGVVVAGRPEDLPPTSDPAFVVYCDTPLDNPAPLVRAIEQAKPVHVSYRLKIKSDRTAGE